MIDKLKKHWCIVSNYQLMVIILVFAINGSLSAKISKIIMSYIGINSDNTHWLFYYLLLFLMVIPIYPFLLLFFGYIFGQSSFFNPFSKKLIQKMGLKLLFKNK